MRPSLLKMEALGVERDGVLSHLLAGVAEQYAKVLDTAETRDDLRRYGRTFHRVGVGQVERIDPADVLGWKVP